VTDEFDAREGFTPDLIADDVVFVPVCVDNVPHRLRRQPPQRGDDLFRRGDADIRVNNHHVIIIDDEYGVRLEPQAQKLIPNQRVDAFGDLLNFKVIPRFLRQWRGFKPVSVCRRDADRQSQEEKCGSLVCCHKALRI
jgi:hypothetical protein